jgi:hypothetical protein
MMSLPALRRLLFYLFLAAFLILCPLVILHVLGYDLRLGGRKPIVATGDLYVASFPAGARVFVDDQEHARPTPTSILDLKPGMHKLTLWAQGYLPWTVSLTVAPGKTAVFNDVLLLPEHWPTRELDPQSFSDVLPMSEYPYLLLRRGPLLHDLFLFELTRKQLQPVTQAASPEAAARILSIVPLASGSVLLIEAELDSTGHRFLLHLQPGEVVIEDVTALVPAGIGTLQCSAVRPEELFYFRGGRVYRVDVPGRRVYPPYAYRVRGYGLDEGTLYLLAGEGSLLSLSFDGGTAAKLPGYRGVSSLSRQTGFVRLTALPNDTMVLHGENGDLLVSGKQGSLSLRGVKGYRVHPRLPWLLLWQEGRMGVVDLAGAAPEAGKGHPGNRGASPYRVAWISTGSPDVDQAFFVLEATHLLYREADRVMLVSPERGGERKTVPVGEVLPGTSVFYSDEDGALYFIDPLSHRPFRLAMVEKTQTVQRLLLDLRARVPR